MQSWTATGNPASGDDMPFAPPRACRCGAVIPAGKRCERCYPPEVQRAKKAAFDATRASAAERGYDAAWRRVRKDFLAKHPTCCAAGCTEPATDVDHIKSIQERPDLRLSWSNLRPFCHSHHSQRTARDQGFARTKVNKETKR